MTKPNKLFSWLGFGKKPQAQVTEQPAAELPGEQQLAQPEPLSAQPQPAAPEQATETPAVAISALTSSEAQAAQSEQSAQSHQITEVADTVLQPVSAQSVAADTTAIKAEEKLPAAESQAIPAETALPVAAPASEPSAQSQPTTEKKPGFFARLKQGLSKTSQNLGNGLASLFLGKKIDDDLYEELETQLLMADVGVDTSQKLIKQLVQHADRRQLKDADSLYEKLQQEMAELLDVVEQPLQVEHQDGPFVILMVGVNGVGKTTTIGKMAQQFKQQGKSVMLAAGDTFRAAAVEQLQVWGERNQIPVIAQHSGADSASVIFDAYQAAKARKIDVLIADTAGRLQNKAHLMEELKKIVRVMKKIDGAAPHEVMLTLDAGTGQNALSQAKLFHEAVELTGISLTKLDGTAKGGVIFAIADQFKLPIRYIGVGESIDDLRVFNSKDFIRALFNKEF
ncbi:signal recognition particle-docking protein FtsY [Rheinheimera sp. 4Y26]|uniref:signal recognition particle-docking protein FtsY n=1 Tax=Rheinheimera sp. 4Y26 TaxID=2977811 RepID=UPI0021B0BE4A|nr:signal recognition particle-docking protein FtsY [Rheinheimera sp. 4Y26]MCT6698770.1 signal recognition particle-docking protein FtsY [Rheinheimera sp. 4Y26]